jgi:hypothetical protein
MTDDRLPFATPSPDVCWSGGWSRPAAKDEMWALAAMGRTVHTLPALHPWRLGDDKGTGRVLLWAGQPDDAHGIAILGQTGRDPELETGYTDDPFHRDEWSLVGGRFSMSPGSLLDVARQNLPWNEPRWIGGLCQIVGAWFPDLAVLPQATRELDDPGTAWTTESVDFGTRYTVQAADTRFAADVLAPHVMALIMDSIPPNAAVTMAGDALHVWQPYDNDALQQDGLGRRLVSGAIALREAIPSFIYTDHPDHSDIVEADLAAKAAAAEAYRANRHRGHTADPTLQRIYDQAQAAWQAGNVSSMHDRPG